MCLLTIFRWHDVLSAKSANETKSEKGRKMEEEQSKEKQFSSKIRLRKFHYELCVCAWVCSACEYERFSSVNKHMETRKVLCVSVCL